MKEIDKKFSHLPEEDAIAATKAMRTAQAQPELRAAFLKEEEKTQKYRDEFVRQDRRTFLDIVTKSGIAGALLRTMPLLGGVMSARHAMAQDLTNKRVVFLYINSGAARGSFLPSSSTQMNQATTKYGPGAGNYDVAGLCNFRALNVVTGGHESMENSLGSPNDGSVTVDKRIADVYAASTTGVATLRNIYLGVGASGRQCSSYGRAIKDLEQKSDGTYGTAAQATQIVNDIFGSVGVTPSPTDNTGQLAYNAQLRAIDSIKRRLSAEEAIRLEEHTATLNKIKTQIAASSSSSGNPVAACQSPAANPGAHFVDAGKKQADIILAALACGITKVATLQMGTEQAQWKGFGTSFTQVHHDAAHSVPTDAPFIELNRYANEVPAYFIDRLRTIRGPDNRPLIETTVFVQVTCMGSGRDHGAADGPFVVATQLPGFRSGFSATGGGGTVRDLASTIPKGLGIPGIVYGGSTNTLGLLT